MDDQNHKMILFTAPSGAGKTTIVRHLMKTFPFLGFSVSATTRTARPHEVNGKDYFFITKEEFEQKIAEKAFAEYEEVYKGQYYGTLKSEIQRVGNEGKVVVFDIDVKGAVSIKTMYGDQCLSVFVRPPSLQTLIDRLKSRKTESEESFKRRILRAKKELTYENRFDKVLVNDILEVTLKEAEILVKDFLDMETW